VATVPYFDLLTFLIPWDVPAVLRTALRAIVLRGALVAEVLLRAVCLVRAIIIKKTAGRWKKNLVAGHQKVGDGSFQRII